MKRFLLRLFLFAAVFNLVVPMLPGIKFQGDFLLSIGAGLIFAGFGWIVEAIAISISTMLKLDTFSGSMQLLVPAWLIAFLFLPMMMANYIARVMPDSLSFRGWEAVSGAILMLAIGVVTSGKLHEQTRKMPTIRVGRR